MATIRQQIAQNRQYSKPPIFHSHLQFVTFQTAPAATKRCKQATAPAYIGRIAKISPIARIVSMTQAVYIHRAGGSNLAATKNPSASGTKNFAKICGTKNSPQINRRMLNSLVRSKFSAR